MNKLEAYALAKLHNVRTPETIRTDDYDQARDFLTEHKHVIVKPSNQAGSRGLTVDVKTEDELKSAIATATFDGYAPLIQEQFIGEEMRLTVLKGKVRSAILRTTPQVVGDGVRSVRELIAAENIERESLHFQLLSYPQLDSSNIPAKYLEDETILSGGEILELSKSTMIRNGASYYGVMNGIHPDYIAIAETLAQRLNPPMLVIDLMMRDHTAPVDSDNYIFLEFNTAPAPAVYSSLRAGDSPDIVKEIVEMIDECSLREGNTYATL
jgi:D-alanine-D-alanine ligase-like ATP-grasp enzyme